MPSYRRCPVNTGGMYGFIPLGAIDSHFADEEAEAPRFQFCPRASSWCGVDLGLCLQIPLFIVGMGGGQGALGAGPITQAVGPG